MGLATAYDVLSGSLSTLTNSGGDFALATQACVADNLVGTSLQVTDVTPVTGDGHWYLARALNCRWYGTYDSGDPFQIRSRDTGINASPSSCP